MASIRILHSLALGLGFDRRTVRAGTVPAWTNNLKNGILTGLACLMIAAGQAHAGKITLGWVEEVWIGPIGIVLAAKLDTGADHSSLHASDVRLFQRGRQTWVSFAVEDGQGARKFLELPVLRIAKIRQHGGRSEQRPVVKLQICIGKTLREAEVNLVDRTSLEYLMLIGRSFMKDNIVVDPGLTFTTEPNCEKGTIDR